MRVTCLSGGVGGAKLARGLQDALSPGELTVIGNVGDDVEVLGLHVSPDLDSILYALAGLNDEERGWGRAGESWRTLESAVEWGGEDWFRLGDLDLGLHLVRTQALGRGEPLSGATARLVDRAGVATRLLPATDDRLRTTSSRRPGASRSRSGSSSAGTRTRSTRSTSTGRMRRGPRRAWSTPSRRADLLVLAPSNPYVSLGPILAVPMIRGALATRRARCVAVSPLIGGRAVKGPLDRMLLRMAGGTSPAHVAGCYDGLIDALVIDDADAPAEAPVPLVVTDTLMTRPRTAARRLAETVLEAGT